MASSYADCNKVLPYLIHHIVLPPGLPEQDDRDPLHERQLLDTTILALQDLGQHVVSVHKRTIEAAIATVERLRYSKDKHGHVSETQIQNLLAKTLEDDFDGFIPLEIKAQNAGILMSRCGHNIKFEFFELSPTNAATMKTQGRLRRKFPASATEIAMSNLRNQNFVRSISRTLAKLIAQKALEMQPKVKKRGYMHDEERDTSDPAMITDYFMRFTAAIGNPVGVERITKNTREEVLWRDCQLPWRRSPLWLLVRVALQLLFSRSGATTQPPDSLYKAFMIFMLARLLEMAKSNWQTLGGEPIKFISAKLSKRLRKLEHWGTIEFLNPNWSAKICSAVVEAHETLRQHFIGISKSRKPILNIESLRALEPKNDTEILLPNLDTFIEALASRKSIASTSNFKPTSEDYQFDAESLPHICFNNGAQKLAQLVGLEEWVRRHLNSWTNSNVKDEGTCGKLRHIIQTYYSNAKETYEGIPINLSTMYLTLLELWVACDKSACSIFSLLPKYDHEVFVEECQAFILPFKSHLSRLAQIERYVDARRHAAIDGRPSVFRDFGHPDSFAVKYFDSNRMLQDVFARIEEKASQERQQKREEYARVRSEYRQLMAQYEDPQTTCDTYEIEYGDENEFILTEHSDDCAKCKCKEKANLLRIRLHEWPLDPEPPKAKATVFELKVPQAYSDWRDCSIYLISDVLGFEDKSDQKLPYKGTLDLHHGLSSELSRTYSSQRIIILSTVKSHTVTHRDVKEAVQNLTVEDICLDNGLKYEYYDKTQNMRNPRGKSTGRILRKCLYSLPKRSKALRRYMIKTHSSVDGPAPNDIMANLADCPHHFSIDEYKAFCALPLSHRVVYLSILTQLAMPAIDFAKAEVQSLILQVIHQTGPPLANHVERSSHYLLARESFGHVMLDHIQTAMLRVAENWESWRALASFIRLAQRVLCLTSSKDVRNRCYKILGQAQSITMKWLNRLKQRASTSILSKQRDDFRARATEVALVCASTFEVDHRFIGTLLRKPSAVLSLLQSSIMVQENVDTVRSDSKYLLNNLLCHWRSMMCRILPDLRDHILKNPSDLNAALRASWADFSPEPKARWAVVSGSWIHINSGEVPVHFDLRTAELRVNGQPLARLPINYMQHPMYNPLFENSTIEVVPTSEPGMAFSAKSHFNGNILHFGMSEDRDLLVSATTADRKLNLIPPRLFRERLPDAFVKNYIHWFDNESREVIFRPRNCPWEPSSDEWRLRNSGSMWQLVKDGNILVNPCSDSARELSKAFSRIEDPQHIHVVLRLDELSTHLSLPRLKLDFDFRHGNSDIASRQYRGMIIDSDQTTGTLVGLESTLVLKCADQNQDRLVLIPAPHCYKPRPISYTMVASSHHVSVTISKELVSKVYAYSLDNTHGRLVDAGDLHSKLLLAYLHALTSGCVSDPLTGYTGTESALTILRSGAVRSFDVLSESNINLLELIARISPHRTFYPAEMMEMQMVLRDKNLPISSQHPSLRECARDIVYQAQRMSIFDPTLKFDIQDWKLSNAHLELRDAIRSSTFYVCGFGAEDFNIVHDADYECRDLSKDLDRSHRVFKIACSVLRDGAALSMSLPDLKVAMLERHFANNMVQGPKQNFDISILRYDSTWMADASETLREHWCSIQRAFSLPDVTFNKFDIATWLSTMAYAPSADIESIEALASFYALRDLDAIHVPSAFSFHLQHGDKCDKTDLQSYVSKAARRYEDSAEARLPQRENDSDTCHRQRKRRLFKRHSKKWIEACAAAFEKQWPCTSPTIPDSEEMEEYIHMPQALSQVTACFKRWSDNGSFFECLDKVAKILAQQPVVGISVPQAPLPRLMSKFSVGVPSRYLSTECIFQATSICVDSLPMTPVEPTIPILPQDQSSDRSETKLRLEALCASLQLQAKSKCEKGYVESLRASCASLELQDANVSESTAAWISDFSKGLPDHLDHCKKYLHDLNMALFEVLANSGSDSNKLAFYSQHCPRVCPSFWLVQLQKPRFEALPDHWQLAVIKYGLAVVQLHRAQRLVALLNKPAELLEELCHVGHTNWDPRKHPETLLLQAESKIMVRHKQEFIASKMRDPENGKNIVLQLLMGAGKSSIIVPMVAASVADQKTLVRVIVTKPQSKQMLQILISKLGGLLNRRIYQMPFTRSVRLTLQTANDLRNLYQECMENRGVLLVQPEHLLSFKLMGIESLLTHQAEMARCLLETQQYFYETSRDIVDESDLNFSPNFELVYTMGSQQTVDFAPERWLIIQDVMRVLARVAPQVKQFHPDGMEVDDQEGERFPKIRLLDLETADDLSSEIADRILTLGIRGVPTGAQALQVKAPLLAYVRDMELSTKEIQAVQKTKFLNESTRLPLLVVRGLIAGGILQFALSSKRWRVNFGTDASRTPQTSLAVPYRSKDSPSPRSEFSHPEVVIILTLLSYYYGGLSDEQLFDAFAHLLRSDQAERNYSDWVETASSQLSPAYKHLSGVSIRDRLQCTEEVFPHLRYSKNAIDYYLAFLVFPKEMKQFSEKLSCSGWDIGAVKTHPTCGFSGTNDTHHLLPLSVYHLNLPSQSHTNAQVLGYLLQDDTDVQRLPPRSSGSDAEHLLNFINTLDMEIRVILDCGASILEQNNKQVAQTWLNRRSHEEIQAVVYFREEELYVLDRTGRVEAFQTSPFAKQLDSCLIYLDEAHTRGTDLKLPLNYRAAVTLGARLTKDTLTQACMRMRQLGKGQAITFIVPEEISTKVRDQMGKGTNDAIEVNDVLCWSIRETWDDLKKSIPLWAVQGHRFESNKHHLINGPNTTYEQAQQCLEDENQSLEARYEPRNADDGLATLTKDWGPNNEDLQKIIARCRDFDATGFNTAATLTEEQERELAPEIEQERQVERPPRMDAAEHTIDPELIHLAQTGKLPPEPSAIFPAFVTLESTSAAQLYDLRHFPDGLLATVDYVRTVKDPAGTARASYVSDSYQRPIHWIVSVTNDDDVVEHLIIISQYEANALLEEIEKHSKVTLHLFAPQLNSSFAPLDELSLYTFGRKFDPKSIPRSLTVQLNIFSGSLYFRSFEEYEEVCDCLGLLHSEPPEGRRVNSEGFILPPSGKWNLKTSPVPFLRTLLMKIRREGEGVEKTHMGKILSGIRLEEDEFPIKNEETGEESLFVPE